MRDLGDLTVGMEAIDADHRNLFQLVDRLHEAMRAEEGRSIVGEIIESLVDYTEIHFSREEAEMERLGYYDRHGHRREHQALLEQVQTFKARFDKSEASLSIELLEFLSSWLSNHIRNADRAMASFLRSRKAMEAANGAR